jgi:hypothetical protein
MAIESSFNKNGSTTSLNMIDDVTLAYMVNTTQYEKYLKKNNMDYDSGFKRDIRFYRKRIISLTKDLFKEQVENDKNQNVLVGAFNMYMRACISYLKFSDQSETIQKCYVCLGLDITDADDDNHNQNNENINQKCICKNKNENDLFELNKANELCFKPKEVKKITLDNYIIRKNVKRSEPIIYPQQFTFNPRDPTFKHKGLKPKPQSRSQSAEKMRIDSNIHDINEIGDNDKMKELSNQSNEILKRVTSIESGENGEKMIKNSSEKINEKINEKKKKKKNKKVSFDVTNYIDNI